MKHVGMRSWDGKNVVLTYWETESPKAVVQILHGMSEHMGRYDAFANYLVTRGYAVVGDDHRAHGITDSDALGISPAGGDLFAYTVRDEAELTARIKKITGLPVLMFGHSYGSFLAQAYLLDHSADVAACVLCGSARQPSAAVGFGRLVARMKCMAHADAPASFFAKMTFGAYDKKVGEGPNAWLSRNAESNARYNADPLCNFVCSNGFYRDMFGGLKKLNASDFRSVRSDLPLLIVYGTEDYVGGRGKYVRKLTEKYTAAKLSPRVIAYEGDRHELLNELDREKVYSDVADFFDAALAAPRA